MKVRKLLTFLVVVMTAMGFTSCDKAADVVLEAFGAYTFNENAALLQKDGDNIVNVTSKTITVELGTKSSVYLFIGNKNTKATLSYSKTTWASDDTEVATVTSSKSNGMTVTIVGEGIAEITATDVEGNKLTTTIEVVGDSDEGDDPEDDEGGEGEEGDEGYEGEEGDEGYEGDEGEAEYARR